MTSRGALSEVDGVFRVEGVPVGEQALNVSLIGYDTKSVTGVRVVPGGTVEQDVALTPAAVAVEGITVSAERGSVERALDEQRTATGMIGTTTAEQIARGPDSDAAHAIARVSGVTVRDGKYVFVRGLGERYTTASLNGARIPSPDPEKKVVPLDLFPAGLLEGITTSKTFTPDQTGDFSNGLNTAAVRGEVLRGSSSGLEWLGRGWAAPPSSDRGGVGLVLHHQDVCDHDSLGYGSVINPIAELPGNRLGAVTIRSRRRGNRAGNRYHAVMRSR